MAGLNIGLLVDSPETNETVFSDHLFLITLHLL